jgi:hypothetical protein
MWLQGQQHQLLCRSFIRILHVASILKHMLDTLR